MTSLIFATSVPALFNWSGIGPVCYVVTASDRHPVNSGNLMSKYADDTYLIIPASNVNTCTAEVEHIEAWSNANNLQLNPAKSLEIIVERPRSNRKQTIHLQPCQESAGSST